MSATSGVEKHSETTPAGIPECVRSRDGARGFSAYVAEGLRWPSADRGIRVEPI